MNMQKVVLIEDEKELLEIISESIEQKLAAKVHCFSQPTQAINFLCENKVNLLISDYLLSGITAADMVGTLRKAEILIPILFITGVSRSECIHEIEVLGKNIFLLEKPFSMSDLIEMVSSLLENSQPHSS